MVIFLEDGRFGNQLFQYLGLKNYYPNHLLILFGFNDLCNVIDVDNAIIFRARFFKNVVFLRVMRLFLKFLSGLRIISKDVELNQDITYSISKKNGLFIQLRWLSNAFFQHNNFINLICNDHFPVNFVKNSKFLVLAKKILDDLRCCYKNEQFVFVHIRRGDYKIWPSADSPAVLPIEWYLRTMNQLRSEIKSSRFLIFTDDHEYVREKLNGINDVTVVRESIYVDFLIMAQCEHGIMSASSFSWWAGYLAHKKNPKGKFIGPRYWVGHRKEKWYPLYFKFDWIDYESTNFLFIEK